MFRFIHSQHKYTVKSAPIFKKNLNKNKLNNINNTNRRIVCACVRITRMQSFFVFLTSMTKLCDKMGKKDWNGKRHRFYTIILYTLFIAIWAGARTLFKATLHKLIPDIWWSHVMSFSLTNYRKTITNKSQWVSSRLHIPFEVRNVKCVEVATWETAISTQFWSSKRK